ncbi:BRCT domain-containing protein [Chaetomium strumarium]|uniref:BRCT domain-containing protein n=1 Tax=Chaetomium strumarium TaxID=1170767 RepID=A0AAJ0GKM2_9PEZI|nr:BRCT domain-containing protein [Chaetomium strumarium]
MAIPPAPFDGDESLFDSAQPFKGVVVCCTSIPTELRADIAAKTAELGGQHKYDLMPDCTHLIVGDYDTPKYRHVAKERPDVRVMAAGWVEAVRNLWVQDVEIDFLALEREWQLRTFETGGGEPTTDGSEPQRRRLLCCMTGFEDPDERQHIIDKIEANGGLYTGDLTKRVTHLIVYKPEGRKYQAAKNWGVATVSVEWVHDSVERGLILDEKLYDPVSPQHERGVGAWNKQRARVSSLGKRLRENSAAQDEGKRKLRKTASMKLNSQRDNLWGDILRNPQAPETASTTVAQNIPANPAGLPPTHSSTSKAEGKSLDTQGSKLSSFGVPDDSAVFASCCFYVHGFSAQRTEILINTVASLGGLVCHSLDEVTSTSGAQLAHRFLIVPQTSAPDTRPKPPGNVHIITEFYIERCLHKKYFFDPSQHVIGRPFPLFPIPGFEDLSICTAGFTGVDLNQVDKSIRQLGAKYEERFTANASLLVSPSLPAIRKQKLELALAWKVPVVSADWLWECISTGRKVPIKRFLFPELKQNFEDAKTPTQTKEVSMVKDSAKNKQERRFSRDGIDEDLLPKPATKPKQRRELDESAFVIAREETEEPDQRRKGPPATEHESNVTTTTHFETAPTHINAADDINISFGKKNLSFAAPLSETSSNSFNKPQVTPRNPDTPRPRKPMSRIVSEVADSEATEGDVGHPHDIPPHENEENLEKSAETRGEDDADRPDPEAEQKRLEAKKVAAEERLAISTKLVTSLLDSTTAKLASTVSAPAALAAMSPTGPDPAAGEDRPKRRKRNILGRAISNVSAASSASGGGTDASAAAPPPLAGIARSDTLGSGVGEAPPPPAATQLEYEDPEARRYKEQLMNKMMGTTGGSTLGRSFSEPRQEKLTLAGLGGYDSPQQRYDAVAGGERRTRRR